MTAKKETENKRTVPWLSSPCSVIDMFCSVVADQRQPQYTCNVLQRRCQPRPTWVSYAAGLSHLIIDRGPLLREKVRAAVMVVESARCRGGSGFGGDGVGVLFGCAPPSVLSTPLVCYHRLVDVVCPLILLLFLSLARFLNGSLRCTSHMLRPVDCEVHCRCYRAESFRHPAGGEARAEQPRLNGGALGEPVHRVADDC